MVEYRLYARLHPLSRSSAGRSDSSRAGRHIARGVRRGVSLPCPAPLPTHPRDEASGDRKQTHLVRQLLFDRLDLGCLDDQMASVQVGDDELVLGREHLVPVQEDLLDGGVAGGQGESIRHAESGRERASKEAAGRAWVAISISSEVSERVWEGWTAGVESSPGDERPCQRVSWIVSLLRCLPEQRERARRRTCCCYGHDRGLSSRASTPSSSDGSPAPNSLV